MTDFETGQIREVADDYAIVELQEQDNCASCGARILCKTSNSGKRLLRVKNTISAKAGEFVEISESGNLLLKISLLQYGLPLIGFLLGIVLCNLFIPNHPSLPAELIWFGAGLFGMILFGFISRMWGNSLVRKRPSPFEVIRALN